MTTTTIDTDTDHARPTIPVPPPAPTNSHLRARQRFEFHIARLRTETRLGAPRANLSVLVRLCEALLDESGSGKMVDQYRSELGRAKAGIVWRTTGTRTVR